MNFRPDKKSERRVGLAFARMAEMTAEQRATMTAERLASSFGLTSYESAQLLQSYGGR